MIFKAACHSPRVTMVLFSRATLLWPNRCFSCDVWWVGYVCVHGNWNWTQSFCPELHPQLSSYFAFEVFTKFLNYIGWPQHSCLILPECLDYGHAPPCLALILIIFHQGFRRPRPYSLKAPTTQSILGLRSCYVTVLWVQGLPAPVLSERKIR